MSEFWDVFSRLVGLLFTWRFLSGALSILLVVGVCAHALVCYAGATKRTPEQIGRPRPFLPVMDFTQRWWKQLMDWTLFWVSWLVTFSTLLTVWNLYTFDRERADIVSLAIVTGMIVGAGCAFVPVVQCLGTYVRIAVVSMRRREKPPAMQEFWNMFWDVDNGYV